LGVFLDLGFQGVDRRRGVGHCELAKRTRFLRDIVHQQLDGEKNSSPAMLTGFYEAFQKFLIGDLTGRGMVKTGSPRPARRLEKVLFELA
jgi:hypothetical protein